LVFLACGVAAISFGGQGRPDSKPAADSKTSGLRSELLNPKMVEPINADEFRRLLAYHRGKVLVVNLWATWCIPCIRELPDLVKLQESYKERSVRVVGISLDDPEDLNAKVKPFIQKRAPGFVTYLQNEPDPEKFVNVVDPSWEGIIPTTYVIDRAGKVKAKLVGGKTYEQFERVVAPLLNETSK
jgi:thiol-disulfide isomerase/thioredoxin